uniref:RUN domain-containing protein n=1 Tax=Poecilia mexicana TaxID=48701 RepID=A0A3B3X6Q6_9TELE
MNMAKLSIKGLIESALNLGRTLDSDYAPLQQFFVVMEHCLKHGLKSRFCRHNHGKVTYFSALTDLYSITTSKHQYPDVKTSNPVFEL